MGRVRRRLLLPQPTPGGRGPVPFDSATAGTRRERDAVLGPDGHHHPRRHGRRGDPRSPRWWLRPLLHRRRVARAPLREDALRPGRPAARLPARLAGDRLHRVPVGDGGHRDLRRPRPHQLRRAGCTRPRTPTPKGSRASSTSGPGRRSPEPWPTAGRPAPVHPIDEVTAGGHRVVRRDRAGQLRAAHHPPAPGRSPPPRSSRPWRAGRTPAVRARAGTGPARPRRQGPHRVERDVQFGSGGGGRSDRRPGLGRGGGGDRGVPLRTPGRRRRALAAELAARRWRPPPCVRR